MVPHTALAHQAFPGASVSHTGVPQWLNDWDVKEGSRTWGTEEQGRHTVLKITELKVFSLF